MNKLTIILFIFTIMPAFADHPIVAFGNETSGLIVTIAAPTMPSGTWGGGSEQNSLTTMLLVTKN